MKNSQDNVIVIANEPEEGEIVDVIMDYELISSDEEICMRQRIQELEAENEEIEQIAVISRSYDLDRAARIPTDVSSISSTEFKTPKKHKRHRNKDHKKKSCHHNHSHHHRHHAISTSQQDKKIPRSRKSRCKRREKLLKKKHDKYAYKDFNDKLLLEANESLNSSISSTSDSDEGISRLDLDEERRDEDDYYQQPGIRDTLRLAVARHRKNSTRHKNGLKEKLMRRDVAFTGNLFSLPNGVNDVNEIHEVVDDEDDAVEICEPVVDIPVHVPDDSSDDSLEERELRLIALKSAVMKKHMERKRRNAEVAYSPTDFDEIMMNEDKLADIEVVDLEEDDSQNACATASPIASPQLMLLDGPDDSSQMVDCKPVDMDLAGDSDSEDASAANNAWHIKMPSEIPFPPYPPKDNTFSYGSVAGLYMSEFTLNATNPPPPGVDDYEEMKQPLMNFGKFQDIQTQDMELENDDFEPIVSYPRSTQNSDITLPEFKVNSNSASLPNEEDIQEEEELALRALLLSKFQSPKNQKKCVVVERKESSNEVKTNLDTGVSVVKPTEAILKEAVKRLQIHSQFDCRKEEIQQLHEASNGTPPSWEHYQFQQQRFIENGIEEGFSDVSLPWDHKQQINIERDSVSISMSWNYQRPEISPYCSQDANEDSKDLPIIALVSLHRKAQELKINSESKEMERPRSVNGVPAYDDKSTDEVSKERQPTEIVSVKPIEIMDEDNKRRLQKLKDDILSATRRNDMQLESTVQNSEIVQLEIEINKRQPKEEILVENGSAINVTPDNERLDPSMAMHANGHVNDNQARLDKSKSTVKLHSDISKTLTTHKTNIPTINTNSTANQGELSNDKVALKENNVNRVNKKNLKTNIDIPAIKKTAQEPAKKAIKTLNRTVAAAKTKETQSPSLSTSVVAPVLPLKTTAVNVKPTYSVMRTTKIVKPNKVINRNIDPKRKVILIKSDQTAPPAKLMKVEPPVTAVKSKATVDDTSRLITSMEQVKHMCNVAQLVISVQNSSNESSDEEWANCDSMYKPLGDYNDIASPLSLNLESPCLTPVRSNSPVDAALGKEKSFEEKVNCLLRAKRSLVTVKPPEKIVSPKTPVLVSTQKSVVMTPVAVRHLPAAAQDEYRKLIHRMKLLENQRNKKDSSTNGENNIAATSSEVAKVESDSVVAAGNKPSLVRQVLLRNTNNKPSTGIVVAKTTEPPVPPKVHKANVLRSYESLYVKIGAGIVNNLDKSLRLVEEAKKVKVNKLRLEIRLKELKAEMELLQTKHKEEEIKMSRIYPNICTTNEVISSLKQKRSRVSKSALSLGKALKGDDYRLNNDLKQNIMNKTKQLANEIKLVNSLKASNIKKEEVYEPVRQTQVETEEKKCENSNPEKMTKSDAKISPEIAQNEEKEDIVSEGPHSENSGNTEFQDTAPTCDTQASAYETNHKLLTEAKPNTGNEEDVFAKTEGNGTVDESEDKILTSYISPLEHLRNSDGALAIDPNGVICPYELMGNCEDAACKYVHISQEDKSQTKHSRTPPCSS